MSQTPTARALALANEGRADDAAVALSTAGEQDDVDALMQLAVWHLVGQNVPRDPAKARVLLRRAVAIGHVDGALMEVALTANGTGNAQPADFAAARRLLDIAAAGDPIAARQAELVARMTIDATGTPLSLPDPEVLSEAPHILRYPRLLTPDECGHIATTAADLLEPARVIDPRTGRWIPHPIRTSDGGAIGPVREDLVVRAINLRIASASGTRVDQGEPLTVLRYRPGQQYRPHLDTIDGASNQRIKTALVYLNQGFAGGETSFPLLPLTIRPAGGDVIVYTNVLPTGAPDPQTRHAGLPVTDGVKWMATRWIREQTVDPWTLA